MNNIIAVAAALFVIVFMILFSPFLEINEVELIDDQNCAISSRDYIDENIIGKNIMFLSVNNIVTQIESKYTCVDKIDIEKQIPQKIIINITSKKPIANIDKTDLQVTKDGLLLNSKSSLDLPSISFDDMEELNKGDYISNDLVLQALEISDKLFKSDFIPSVIIVSDKDGIIISSSKLIAVQFSPSNDPGSQVDSLQLILGKAKIDAEKIEKIDLRFDQPVVTYK